MADESSPFRRGQRPPGVTDWHPRTPAFRRLFHDVYVDRAAELTPRPARACSAPRRARRDGLAPQCGAAVGRHRSRRRSRAPGLPEPTGSGRGHPVASVRPDEGDDRLAPSARDHPHPDLPRPCPGPRPRRSRRPRRLARATETGDHRAARRGCGGSPRRRQSTGPQGCTTGPRRRRLGDGDAATDAHGAVRTAGARRQPQDPLARRAGPVPLRPRAIRRRVSSSSTTAASTPTRRPSGARTWVGVSGWTATTGASSSSSPRRGASSTARQRDDPAERTPHPRRASVAWPCRPLTTEWRRHFTSLPEDLHEPA